MLIILPANLRVSGITTWATRAVDGLRKRSIPAGLLVHLAPGESVPEFLIPYVVATVENATPIDQLNGDLEYPAQVYLKAIKEMHTRTNRPVVVSPNVHGDCYGIIASLTQTHPNLIRTVSWIHSDNEYDLALTRRFEPILHAIVPVSKELASITKQAIPQRASDIIHIPHCVDSPDSFSTRDSPQDRSIRILYSGRIEEHQKRISTLPILAKELNNRGVTFELRIVGDGPAMDSIKNQTRPLPNVNLIGPVPPNEVHDHLKWADLWVLPSRFEGQSVAMLEALAAGCLPIVTKVRSGSNDAIIDGQTGICIDAHWDTPIEKIAQRMCDAIVSTQYMDTQAMARKAYDYVCKNHSIDTHVDNLESLIEHVTAQPDLAWPKHLRASYSAPAGELDGSTPHDAAQRMTTKLNTLDGKNTLIYCSGQHTKDIAHSIQSSPANIIGIIDDNPSKVGTQLLGYPIYTPKMIPDLDATDLVISSWIYENTIWSKRATLESNSLKLHRLYPPDQA